MVHGANLVSFHRIQADGQVAQMFGDLSRLPPGCSFAPRCPYVVERCRDEAPHLQSVGTNHLASCWMARDLGRTAVPAAGSSR